MSILINLYKKHQMKKLIEGVKTRVEFFYSDTDNPENNKLYLKNGGVIPTPNISTLNGACRYIILNNIMIDIA